MKKWLRQILRGRRKVSDLSIIPLPLYMRESAGLPPPEPQKVAECAGCGVRYFERAKGSTVPEDGKCWACSTGKEREVGPSRIAIEHAREQDTVLLASRARAKERMRFFEGAKRRRR